MSDTFVNNLAGLLEKLSAWTNNPAMTKDDVIKATRTHLLQCMRAGLMHPFTSFYSVEVSSVHTNNNNAASQKQV